MAERVWFENSVGSVHLIEVEASAALTLWKEHRARTEETGRWPVLVGDDTSLRILREAAEKKVDVNAQVRRAEGLNTRKISQQRLDSLIAEDELDDESLDDFDASSLKRGTPKDGHPAVTEEGGTVFLALLPTRNGWEAPAHLEYGSWNEYPPIAEHVALLRDWHSRYGAEVITLSSDTIELLLPQPLRDANEAKKVAREWIAYSSDNDMGSLRELAQGLLDTRYWVSWWD